MTCYWAGNATPVVPDVGNLFPWPPVATMAVVVIIGLQAAFARRMVHDEAVFQKL
jgi:hypothetical protein